MRIAADASITKTRRMVLAAVAVMGFGLLQGARFIDVNSGPYSAHSLALFGLFVDGATLLTIAVLSYFGKIDDNRKLYCAGAISCALYLVLSFFDLGDRLFIRYLPASHGRSTFYVGWKSSPTISRVLPLS